MIFFYISLLFYSQSIEKKYFQKRSIGCNARLIRMNYETLNYHIDVFFKFSKLCQKLRFIILMENLFVSLTAL